MGHKTQVVAVSPVGVDLVADWEAYDRFPKRVRLALIEAMYEYSSEQIWEAFRQTRMDEGHFFTAEEAWEKVIWMIGLNDRKLRNIERKEYEDLIIELREEKKQRIESVFLKSSSAASDRATVPGV